MPVGTWNTSQIPQDLAEKSFSAAITRLMPNGGAPLFGLTALLKEETAAQIEHGYFSKTMVFPYVTLSANVAIGDTIINVTTTANIVPGMVIRADSTNENILVVAVMGPTQLLVQRAFGTIAAQAVNSGVNLWMVGNAYEQGSVRPQALSISAVRIVNYTQIFRNSWALTGTVQATQVIAGGTNVAESRQECATFHAVDIEKALFFGQKFLGVRNGQPISTMDGLINTVQNAASGNITTLGATTSYTQLIAALDPVFQQNTDPANPNQRILFCGGVARNVLHAIARLNSTYFVQQQETSWGLQYDTIKIPRGTFQIIEHPLFNAYGSTSTWAKMAVAVDLPTFNLAYMAGRKTMNQEYGVTGTPVDNGVDAVGGTLTTEVTNLVKNPAADAVLYNFTAGVAG
ncbi:MAG: hypothetical protein E6Q97_33335 [Desulfurellales bacterium]|nr:MAG: hypothetical protein E6Q97_33335 [Desulfurellales bacterium]